MKAKRIVGVVAVGAAIVAFSSCKKQQCAECHYDKNGAEVEIGEYCDEGLEDIEANGILVNDTVYVVHCHKH